MSEDEDFVSVSVAARVMGLHPATIRRRVACGELTAYRSGLNRRGRLVRLADLKEYAEPRPIVRPSSSDDGPERAA